MAETRRQINDVLADLPDNVSGDISPEDVRDAVVSLSPQFIQFHAIPASLPHNIVIPPALAWVDIDIGGLFTIEDNWQPAGPPPGSEYVGLTDISIFGLIALSFVSAMQRNVYEFRLTVNGVQDDGSVMLIATGSTAASNTGTGVIPVSLGTVQTGDVIKAQVRGITAAVDIDLTSWSGWWLSVIKP